MATTISILLGASVVKSQTDEGKHIAVQAQGERAKTECPAFNLPDYTEISTRELEQKTDAVLEQRSRAFLRLLAQVESLQTPAEAKAETIYLLGELRAPEAVTALLENLNFLDNRTIAAFRLSDRGGYIARRALVKIGEPSAQWIYLIIADNHSLDTVRFNASQVQGFVEVLTDIETPEVALMKLQHGREEARDAKIKANFDLVIEALEKMPK